MYTYSEDIGARSRETKSSIDVICSWLKADVGGLSFLGYLLSRIMNCSSVRIVAHLEPAVTVMEYDNTRRIIIKQRLESIYLYMTLS